MISADTIVIGAGTAGLTAAFYAKKGGQKVLILESSNRCGGVVRSKSEQGFHLEFGPNTVMPTSDIMDLVSCLHMEENVLLADPKVARFIQSTATSSVRMRTVPYKFVSTTDAIGQWRTSQIELGNRCSFL